MSFSHIREVAELDFSLEPYDWPFAHERAADIEAHWAKRRAAQPALYDGRVLLSQRHAFEARREGGLALRGAYFETAYSRFLSWRDFGSPGETVCNCFSMAALQSADGAFLIGEMNAHTANAGRIYFPAGTPDLEDVFEARVDLLASVRRELEEETGVRACETSYEENWIVVYAPPSIACIKIMRSPETAETLKARIHAFLAREEAPELARMHTALSSRDLPPERTAKFVRDFLDYVNAM